MKPSSTRPREGFQLKTTSWQLPEDLSSLDPKRKRKATICNLFLNHQMPLRNIAALLEESYGSVVEMLIDEGVISDRRKPTGNSLAKKPDRRIGGKWFYSKLQRSCADP